MPISTVLLFGSSAFILGYSGLITAGNEYYTAGHTNSFSFNSSFIAHMSMVAGAGSLFGLNMTGYDIQKGNITRGAL